MKRTATTLLVLALAALSFAGGFKHIELDSDTTSQSVSIDPFFLGNHFMLQALLYDNGTAENCTNSTVTLYYAFIPVTGTYDSVVAAVTLTNTCTFIATNNATFYRTGKYLYEVVRAWPNGGATTQIVTYGQNVFEVKYSPFLDPN